MITRQPATLEELPDDAWKLWVQAARHSFALMASFEVDSSERATYASMLEKLVADGARTLGGIEEGRDGASATPSPPPPRRAQTRASPRHRRAGLGEFVRQHGKTRGAKRVEGWRSAARCLTSSTRMAARRAAARASAKPCTTC